MNECLALQGEVTRHSIGLPIVDFLALDEQLGEYSVAFIPDPNIYHPGESPSQKEGVSLDLAAPAGRRVRELLDDLAELLGLRDRQVRLGHSGNDDFIMFGEQGEHINFPDDCKTLDINAVLQAYDVLRVLGLEAQLEFLRQRRRGLVAAAG